MTISMNTSSTRTFESNRDPLTTDYEVELITGTIPMEVGNKWRNSTTREVFECIEVEPNVSATFNVVPSLERGTFIPSLEFGGNSTGITYNGLSGDFVRVGNAITFNIFMALTSKGSSVGDATIAGLPYMNGDYNSGFLIYTQNVGLSLTYTSFGCRIAPSQQVIQLFQIGSLLSLLNLTNSRLQNNSQIFISGTYFT